MRLILNVSTERNYVNYFVNFDCAVKNRSPAIVRATEKQYIPLTNG